MYIGKSMVSHHNQKALAEWTGWAEQRQKSKRKCYGDAWCYRMLQSV